MQTSQSPKLCTPASTQLTKISATTDVGHAVNQSSLTLMGDQHKVLAIAAKCSCFSTRTAVTCGPASKRRHAVVEMSCNDTKPLRATVMYVGLISKENRTEVDIAPNECDTLFLQEQATAISSPSMSLSVCNEKPAMCRPVEQDRGSQPLDTATTASHAYITLSIHEHLPGSRHSMIYSPDTTIKIASSVAACACQSVLRIHQAGRKEWTMSDTLEFSLQQFLSITVQGVHHASQADEMAAEPYNRTGKCLKDLPERQAGFTSPEDGKADTWLRFMTRPTQTKA
ncbi:hypothetical protein RF11_03681 [Thelohanellus kitauei]|uniref:Uncharacterized protein n=1 Tax=Thelohanellus kitauei TaxID=669202 RepID=A0A0C2N1K8_THEKT|nr:hypothetical protein RF11_03681 [Thelohanellus kitauei]